MLTIMVTILPLTSMWQVLASKISYSEKLGTTLPIDQDPILKPPELPESAISTTSSHSLRGDQP